MYIGQIVPYDEESKILRLPKSDFMSYASRKLTGSGTRKLPIIHSIYKRTFNSAASLKDYSALSFADLVIAVEFDMRLVCGQTRNISEQIRRSDKSRGTCTH